VIWLDVRIDGRTLSHEVCEHIRKMAVKRVAEGATVTSVMASYGLERTAFYRWQRAYRRGGEAALAAKKHPGPKELLTNRRKLQVRRWINGKDPRQFGFDFGLWTRAIVQDLIYDKFDVTIGITAVGRLLHQLDITPQKPLRRAYERDPVAIARWKMDVYPKLKERARAVGSKIFFEDEAGVRSDQVLGRTWAPKGKTPEVPTSGQRQSINAISAVNERGEFWFEVYSEKLNAAKFIRCLKHFMRGRRQPVFMVLDKHPAHIAKVVAKYVQTLKGRLELHFLPGYAPELNPDEFVWNYLKHEGVAKKPLRRGESLRWRVYGDLCRLRYSRETVRSFFYAPSVSYTTD
jgi:transposase